MGRVGVLDNVDGLLNSLSLETATSELPAARTGCAHGLDNGLGNCRRYFFPRRGKLIKDLKKKERDPQAVSCEKLNFHKNPMYPLYTLQESSLEHDHVASYES